MSTKDWLALFGIIVSLAMSAISLWQVRILYDQNLPLIGAVSVTDSAGKDATEIISVSNDRGLMQSYYASTFAVMQIHNTETNKGVMVLLPGYCDNVTKTNAFTGLLETRNNPGNYARFLDYVTCLSDNATHDGYRVSATHLVLGTVSYVDFNNDSHHLCYSVDNSGIHPFSCNTYQAWYSDVSEKDSTIRSLGAYDPVSRKYDIAKLWNWCKKYL